jgi:hypothetical protein
MAFITGNAVSGLNRTLVAALRREKHTPKTNNCSLLKSVLLFIFSFEMLRDGVYYWQCSVWFEQDVGSCLEAGKMI